MEGELWRELYLLLKRLGKGKGVVRGHFTHVQIAAVYCWSVLHDRPVCWACQRCNWHGSCPMKCLPSPSTMSRRLRTQGVQYLLQEVEQTLLDQGSASLCRFIDGKPLPISGHSEDVDAAYGRAASSMARGYKFHGIFDPLQGFVAWAIHPMNISEKKVACQLVEELKHPGYLVGDNAFDTNPLYDMAGQRQIQVLAPRKKKAQGLGHHHHSPYRLRVIDMLTRPFARMLLHQRRCIESAFGQLTGLGFGLAPLPNWVRTIRRVTNWVRIKLVLLMIYRKTNKTFSI